MHPWRIVGWVGALSFAAMGCAARASPPAEEAPLPPPTNGGEAESADEHLRRGIALLEAGRCDEAIRTGFDPAIAAFERGVEPGTRVMASRAGGASALISLMTAATDGVSAVVVGSTWPDTIYLRAFCLVELGRPDEAAQALQRALEMIPDDVLYGSELGHLLQERRDFAGALAVFRAAVENGEMLERTGAFRATPEHPRGVPVLLGMPLLDLRCRAMRGVGFSLIELGDLDGAELVFRQVLVLDPSDERSMGELQYIAQQRAARGGAFR
jgi:tetratricopeptide (TPR) repeat protein